VAVLLDVRLDERDGQADRRRLMAITDRLVRCAACRKLWTEFYASRPWSFRCERCGKVNTSPSAEPENEPAAVAAVA
jgi:phage FluMu protein Com